MTESFDPIRDTTDEARDLARRLIGGASHGVLGVVHPDGLGPYVSRVAVGRDERGAPLLFISSIALHARALELNRTCSLLLGDVEPKGDALTQPRLTVMGKAVKIARLAPDHGQLLELWRNQHKKAQIYIDLPDFSFVRVEVSRAFLNAGFGQAFTLLPADLGL